MSKEKISGRRSAYSFFTKQALDEFKLIHPDTKIDIGGLMRKCAEEWKLLTVEEKRPYEALHEEDVERYWAEQCAHREAVIAAARGITLPKPSTTTTSDQNDDIPIDRNSAFGVFVRDTNAKLKKTRKGWKSGELLAELTRQWKEMNSEEKEKWEKLSGEEKELQEQESEQQAAVAARAKEWAKAERAKKTVKLSKAEQAKKKKLADEKRKEKKREEKGGKPRAKVSAYTFYTKRVFEQYKQQPPKESLSAAQILSKASVEWQKMSEEDRREFAEMAEKDAERYEAEKRAFDVARGYSLKNGVAIPIGDDDDDQEEEEQQEASSSKISKSSNGFENGESSDDDQPQKKKRKTASSSRRSKQ